MKKLYFTVTKQITDIDGVEESNGWKTIDVYEIEDNEPILIFEFEALNTEDTIDAILEQMEVLELNTNVSLSLL